jgi:hypothetical protein
MQRYPEHDNEEEYEHVNISKIVVPTKRDKRELLEAFKYLHDLRNVDTNYYAVNTIVHLYARPDLIEVEE